MTILLPTVTLPGLPTEVKIAFYSTRDGNLGGLGDIYVIKADGR